MAEEKKMTNSELLEEVNRAIYAVLVGGQSYKIGSRSLTRADLSLLRSMQKELSAMEAQGGGCLMDNTYVAVFDSR